MVLKGFGLNVSTSGDWLRTHSYKTSISLYCFIYFFWTSMHTPYTLN